MPNNFKMILKKWLTIFNYLPCANNMGAKKQNFCHLAKFLSH